MYIPMALDAIHMLEISAFISLDLIFLICSQIQIFVYILISPLEYHTDSLQIILLFPYIYIYHTKTVSPPACCVEKKLLPT